VLERKSGACQSNPLIVEAFGGSVVEGGERSKNSRSDYFSKLSLHTVKLLHFFSLLYSLLSIMFIHVIRETQTLSKEAEARIVRHFNFVAVSNCGYKQQPALPRFAIHLISVSTLHSHCNLYNAASGGGHSESLLSTSNRGELLPLFHRMSTSPIKCSRCPRLQDIPKFSTKANGLTTWQNVRCFSLSPPTRLADVETRLSVLFNLLYTKADYNQHSLLLSRHQSTSRQF
jgi:hypothetical protein